MSRATSHDVDAIYAAIQQRIDQITNAPTLTGASTMAQVTNQVEALKQTVKRILQFLSSGDHGVI